jgi:hypothetical protein
MILSTSFNVSDRTGLVSFCGTCVTFFERARGLFVPIVRGPVVCLNRFWGGGRCLFGIDY